MKKASLIIAHQLPEQLNLFIGQLLSDSETEVFIHVNKLFDSIKKSIVQNERVHVLENNIDVYWGSDGILRAYLLLLEYSYNFGYFDYFLINSGQDLLIKNGLDEFLKKNNGTTFIDCKNPPDKIRENKYTSYLLDYWPIWMRRQYEFKLHPVKILRASRLLLAKRGIHVGPRKRITYPHIDELKIYPGYSWSAIPHSVVAYLMDVVKNSPDYMSMFYDSLVPEETFLTTTIMNSKYADTIKYVNGVSHSISYAGSFKRADSNHPGVFTMNDVGFLDNSDYFFARKFDIRIDRSIVDYYYDRIVKG